MRHEDTRQDVRRALDSRGDKIRCDKEKRQHGRTGDKLIHEKRRKLDLKRREELRQEQTKERRQEEKSRNKVRGKETK